MSEQPLPPEPKSIEDYIGLHQQDAVLWKADYLLDGLTNPVLRNEKFTELAHTIALIDKPVAREDYAVKIGKKYGLQPLTFKKMIADAIDIRKRQAEIKKVVRKNKIITLKGNATVYPFFEEQLNKDGSLKDIRINKVKFVELLSSFGFTRYEVGDNDSYTFVRIQDNIIKTVTRDEIIDHIESFVRKDYNFEGAEMEHVDSEMLINKFYDGMRVYFSKDLFARVRTEGSIIINSDRATITYLYYKNGFVEIDANGYTLKAYDEMSGSVWENQMLDRDFKKLSIDDIDLDNLSARFGNFADFCWKVSGQEPGRFKTLCSIIGYLMHDFYQYTLKAINFTDSSLSEFSEGRTGKTLLMKVIAQVRSMCEINGKDFKVDDKNKYQDVRLGTQIIHINDVSSRGRNAFDFEQMFNDVTEGVVVDAKYMKPFRQFSKIAISSNKSLYTNGASARARLIEFEMSDFFGEKKSPADIYKQWFIRDWDGEEFNKFDNFMCYCGMIFHIHGLQDPPSINLEERKLRDHTTLEFVDFMTDRCAAKKQLKEVIEFDMKELYNEFKKEYSDFNHQKFHQRTFNKWLRMFAKYRFGKDPEEWKSNGVVMIKFLEP